ncbi:MAG: hypothetical protein Q9225_001505 [Loekoesia sp. 1 TL-2023]
MMLMRQLPHLKLLLLRVIRGSAKGLVSAATTSTAAEASASKSILQHAMMDNGSLAAVTLDNGNRHVYFQENTGAFRRAIYSPQARAWQASTDDRLVSDAKNMTPLAVIDYELFFDVGAARCLYYL